MKRVIFLVPLLGFILLGALFAFSLGRDPSVLPSARIGHLVPDFDLPPVDPEQARVRLVDLRGQVVVINFFASWCAACRIEHPLLLDLHQRGVPIYGIAWKDTPEASRRWLAAHGSPYVAAGVDEAGGFGIDLGVAAVPETFIVDRQGRVRYRHAGPVTPQVWAQDMAPLIARLAQEKPVTARRGGDL